MHKDLREFIEKMCGCCSACPERMVGNPMGNPYSLSLGLIPTDPDLRAEQPSLISQFS